MRTALIFTLLNISSPAFAERLNAVPLTTEAPSGINQVISRVRAIAQQNGVVVRLYYRAQTCEGHWEQFPPLRITLAPRPRQGRSLQSIEDLFVDKDRVKIDRNTPGIVRITVDEPATDVLSDNLMNVNFDERIRLSPMLSIFSIENNVEFRNSMIRRGMRLPVTVYSIYLPTSTGNTPSMPGNIAGATTDRILDRVATTFNGVVTYALCPDGQQFNIGFASIDD